jgi:hypothetical protein
MLKRSGDFVLTLAGGWPPAKSIHILDKNYTVYVEDKVKKRDVLEESEIKCVNYIKRVFPQLGSEYCINNNVQDLDSVYIQYGGKEVNFGAMMIMKSCLPYELYKSIEQIYGLIYDTSKYREPVGYNI